MFEVRLVTAEGELALGKLDYPVIFKVPVDTTLLEDGQALQVNKCGTWNEMKEYFPFAKGLLSIPTCIKDLNLCRPFGFGIRFSVFLSDFLCLRLAVPSTA